MNSDLNTDKPNTGAPNRAWGLQLITVVEMTTDNTKTMADVTREFHASEEYVAMQNALAAFEARTGAVIRAHRAEINRLGSVR